MANGEQINRKNDAIAVLERDLEAVIPLNEHSDNTTPRIREMGRLPVNWNDALSEVARKTFT